MRATRHPSSLVATNVFADLYAAQEAGAGILGSLAGQLVAIVADAGCGKTQLSAEITAADGPAPPGIVLFRADLQAGHTLDDLARKIVIQGKPLSSFESLVVATDTAGERVGKRIPIVIDGLNESADPRNWHSLLASLTVTLR